MVTALKTNKSEQPNLELMKPRDVNHVEENLFSL